ncbi:hypothetical protein CEXT_125111 [Caerostris extrusa]|uniref:Uncharacterized protein n=1 Tax=Caerostris extrusa TaxID=172846 RepID=A0AAV4S4V9_CAEEX|nr:hypothetical protein CEXT_125111 [Caerostris extrusa]
MNCHVKNNYEQNDIGDDIKSKRPYDNNGSPIDNNAFTPDLREIHISPPHCCSEAQKSGRGLRHHLIYGLRGPAMNRRAVSERASLKSESIWTYCRVCRPTVLPTPKTCLAYCRGLYRGGCLPLRNGTFMDGLTPAQGSGDTHSTGTGACPKTLGGLCWWMLSRRRVVEESYSFKMAQQ